ncbi:MAG: alpha-E domain-containing protein [Anaerolineaceae bacterium]|nr:alpha-E domain-containing protein [Anaerolineaceae bacterium]
MNSDRIMLSRVADSLFWMSRYLERAEHASRLLDVYLNFMLEASDEVSERRLRDLQTMLLSEDVQDCAFDECLRLLTFSENHAASIIYNITQARENARNVREQISSEMWMEINKLYLYIKNDEVARDWATAPHDFFIEVRERSHLFQGVTDATMMHNQGWHFIQIGRFLERSLNLLQLLQVQFADKSIIAAGLTIPEQYFNLVAILKSVTAFEAYCKVYNPNPQVHHILDFLLFNEEFPRSLRFCVERIRVSLNVLNEITQRRQTTRLGRTVGRLASMLRYDEISDVQTLAVYLEGIKQQIGDCYDMLYESYINYSIESELRA